jgi:DNA-directed RNA polymerase beta subunit
LVCHGAASVVRDRLLIASDKFDTVMCQKCGFLAESAAPPGTLSVSHQTAFCRYCKSHDNIHSISIPYAYKLFQQVHTLVFNSDFAIRVI